MKFNVLMSISLAIALTACSNIPDKLTVEETTNLTSFESAQAEKNANVGNSARWGGVIANVTNNADNSVLEIVHFPLTSSARPKQKDQTLGRFRVIFSGLLDPVIYQKGRSITAIGTISTPEQGKIGEHKYEYPVIKANYVHLWKNIQQVDINVMHMGMSSGMMWRQPRPYYHRPVVIRKGQNRPSPSKPAQAVPVNKKATR